MNSIIYLFIFIIICNVLNADNNCTNNLIQSNHWNIFDGFWNINSQESIFTQNVPETNSIIWLGNSLSTSFNWNKYKVTFTLKISEHENAVTDLVGILFYTQNINPINSLFFGINVGNVIFGEYSNNEWNLLHTNTQYGSQVSLNTEYTLIMDHTIDDHVRLYFNDNLITEYYNDNIEGTLGLISYGISATFSSILLDNICIETDSPTLSTLEPTIPTNFPTNSPTIYTNNPTIPTINPTPITNAPTIPTVIPTLSPTSLTNMPTIATVSPTNQTMSPTVNTQPPTVSTVNPTLSPTIPTHSPTLIPTVSPSIPPTLLPSTSPTTETVNPTLKPTVNPTAIPTGSPTYSDNIEFILQVRIDMCNINVDFVKQNIDGFMNTFIKIEPACDSFNFKNVQCSIGNVVFYELCSRASDYTPALQFDASDGASIIFEMNIVNSDYQTELKNTEYNDKKTDYESEINVLFQDQNIQVRSISSRVITQDKQNTGFTLHWMYATLIGVGITVVCTLFIYTLYRAHKLSKKQTETYKKYNRVNIYDNFNDNDAFGNIKY